MIKSSQKSSPNLHKTIFFLLFVGLSLILLGSNSAVNGKTYKKEAGLQVDSNLSVGIYKTTQKTVLVYIETIYTGFVAYF